MAIAGYIAAFFIGLTLGLLGGGGSILSVPILVYLFDVDPVIAAAYSLFIVGITSLAGIVPKFKANQVSLKTALIFGIPSITSVYTTRAYILPAMPDVLGQVGNITITKSLFTLVLFAVLMVLASVSMIRERKNLKNRPANSSKINYIVIFIAGIIEGFLTGLVGAGGGFLIIPILVFFAKLPIKQAIGTSLLIIATKSLIGFTGDLGQTPMDWALLLSVTALAILGVMGGNYLNKRIAANNLKKGFGWFVLVMGVYILTRELVFKF